MIARPSPPHAALLRSAVLLLALFVAMPASAARVFVLDANDGLGRGSGARNRTVVVRALLRNGELELGALADYQRIAERKRVSRSRLATARGVAVVAPAAQADGVVLLRLSRKGGHSVLTARVLDREGVELWSRPIQFEGKRLPTRLADRLAAAVVAAVLPPLAVTPQAPRESPEPRREERYAEERHDRLETRRPERSDEGERGADEVSDETGDDELREDGNEDDVGAGPEGELERDKPLRFPLFDIDGGFAMTWRTYTLQPVNNASAVRYTTQTPYAGGMLEAVIYPLHASDLTLLRGLGVQGAFEYGYLRSKYIDGTTEREFASADLHWSADLVLRVPIASDPRWPVVGVIGGIEARQFQVEVNPVIVGSQRIAPRLGGDVVSALLPPYIALQVGFVGFLAPNPGLEERAAYGVNGVGVGWRVFGAIGNRTATTGLRYALTMSHTQYDDTFTGASTTGVEGGLARETYTTFGLSVGFAH